MWRRTCRLTPRLSPRHAQPLRRLSAATTSPHVVIGTYTIDTGYARGHAPGAYVAALDSATGALSIVDTVTSSIGINPAYAAHSPERSAVYITNEVVEGVVKAFSCCPETKRLTYLNEQPCGGEGPCFLAIGPGPLVYCANYFSGELTAFTTEADGSLAPGVTTPLPGAASFPGPCEVRQDGPHSHCFVPAGDGGLAFSADLGSDEIVVVSVDAATAQVSVVSRLALPSGTGPRHVALTPDSSHLYVCGELGNNLSSCRFDSAEGTLELLATTSVLPEDFVAPESGTTVSHVELSPCGSFAYVGNRVGVGLDGACADCEAGAISVFRVDGAEMELLSFVATGAPSRIRPAFVSAVPGGLRSRHVRGRAFTRSALVPGGDVPRSFCVVPGAQPLLLVGNQESDNIRSFFINENGGLTPTGAVLDLPSPACLLYCEL